MPASYAAARPESVLGYIFQTAQTAKLLSRKNETDAVNEAPSKRNGLALFLSALPSNTIAPYQAQVTK